MNRCKRDIIYSIAIIIFCVVHWIVADEFEQQRITVKAAMPSTYTHMVLGILIGLATIMLLRAIKNKSQMTDAMIPIWNKLSVITVASLLIYVIILKKVGFVISSFLLTAVLFISYTAGMHKFDRKNKRQMVKRLINCLISALLTTVITEVIFQHILSVHLPEFTLF